MQIPIADNAVCFLWATAPKLKEALEVLEAWGFNYKTHAIWDKKIMGMGYWFRGRHELLLVGTKGIFPPPPEKLRIASIFTEKRKEHSKKPYKVRELIEKWYPNSKKIELFARDHIENWDVHGDEVPNTIQQKLNASDNDQRSDKNE